MSFQQHWLCHHTFPSIPAGACQNGPQECRDSSDNKQRGILSPVSDQLTDIHKAHEYYIWFTVSFFLFLSFFLFSVFVHILSEWLVENSMLFFHYFCLFRCLSVLAWHNFSYGVGHLNKVSLVLSFFQTIHILKKENKFKIKVRQHHLILTLYQLFTWNESYCFFFFFFSKHFQNFN